MARLPDGIESEDIVAVDGTSNRPNNAAAAAVDGTSNRPSSPSHVEPAASGERNPKAAQAAPQEWEPEKPTELRAPVSSPAVPVERAQSTPKSKKAFHSHGEAFEEMRGRVPVQDAARFKHFAKVARLEIQDLMLEAWNDLLRKYGFEHGALARQSSERPKLPPAPPPERGAPVRHEPNKSEQTGAPVRQSGGENRENWRASAPLAHESLRDQLINDLDPDQLIDRSISGAPVRHSEEMAREKEDAVLNYYREQTGNNILIRDRHAYQQGYRNRLGYHHPGVADVPVHLIKLGIRQSVIFCQDRVLMFSYCLGSINKLVEEHATAERHAEDQRINKSRSQQEMLPGTGAELTEMPPAFAALTEEEQREKIRRDLGYHGPDERKASNG